MALPAGITEIDYLFGLTAGASGTGGPAEPADHTIYIAGGAAIAAGAGAVLAWRMRGRRGQESQEDRDDVESMLDRSDMREDDKEIVRFIADKGGEALESELRKKFLQPRTTMWRAVKRLERNGVIEIEKKDMQNLVKLRRGMEQA